MPYEQELRVALEAAHRAGQAILARYAVFTAVPDARADITTDADREAQEIILTQLHRRFPGDALCAEEPTAALIDVPSTGARLWVVDPIDGTRGFAQKNGEFSVMIGFVDKGLVAVGVVLEPAAGRLTYAVRGGGCWRQDGTESAPSPCTVSDVAELGAATLTQSRSRPGQTSRAVLGLRPAHVLEMYSAGVKLARVARAEADIYVNTYTAFHDWDICAGHLLLEEAGGSVTGLAGQVLRYGTPGAWQRHGLLATNGHLHAVALAQLRRNNGSTPDGVLNS
jgi:3'(2'), 5'-bisphosphate nucleotidase